MRAPANARRAPEQAGSRSSPPGWQGKLPEDVQRIDAPTPFVWIIGRTQTNGTKDYEAVHKVQAGYTITPLSQSGKAPQPVTATIDPTVDMKTPPMTQVNNMAAGKYFAYAAELLKVNPPHITDQPILARMRRIGIEPGKSFDLGKADASVKRGLERAAPDALKAMQAKIPTLARVVNGWQMNTDTMGVYGNFYLKRAIVALVGLGANLPEDAVYPLNIGDADGKPLTGANQYALHFGKNEFPRRRHSGQLRCTTRTGSRRPTSEAKRYRRSRCSQIQCGRLSGPVYSARDPWGRERIELVARTYRRLQPDHASLCSERRCVDRKMESAAGCEGRRPVGDRCRSSLSVRSLNAPAVSLWDATCDFTIELIQDSKEPRESRSTWMKYWEL